MNVIIITIIIIIITGVYQTQ